MGLYKLCDHKGRARDRCDHAIYPRKRQFRHGSSFGTPMGRRTWSPLPIDVFASTGYAKVDGESSARNSERKEAS